MYMHVIVRALHRQAEQRLNKGAFPMRLSEYTDYTLRVLMCCAREPERRLTIAELAQSLQVSKNHLMKIVNDLARQGMLETTRGRGGGIRLLRAPESIRVGE